VAACRRVDTASVLEHPRGHVHLVTFDVDGTRTASGQIDAECFLQANELAQRYPR